MNNNVLSIPVCPNHKNNMTRASTDAMIKVLKKNLIFIIIVKIWYEYTFCITISNNCLHFKNWKRIKFNLFRYDSVYVPTYVLKLRKIIKRVPNIISFGYVGINWIS